MTEGPGTDTLLMEYRAKKKLCNGLDETVKPSELEGPGIEMTSLLTASPLVSSQRPNTELAAARTEQRELSVVVMPAWGGGGVIDTHCLLPIGAHAALPWQWRWSAAPLPREWQHDRPRASEAGEEGGGR